MPEAFLQPMLTNDAQGIFRQDNHAWLFGWSNGTLFQVRHWLVGQAAGIPIITACDHEDLTVRTDI